MSDVYVVWTCGVVCVGCFYGCFDLVCCEEYRCCVQFSYFPVCDSVLSVGSVCCVICELFVEVLCLLFVCYGCVLAESDCGVCGWSSIFV